MDHRDQFSRRPCHRAVSMLFQSTRQDPRADAVSFSAALLKGLAPDGGLFVPQQWAVLEPAELSAGIGLPADQYLTATGLARFGAVLLAPLLQGSELADALPAISAE